LEFFIDKVLPAALWSLGRLSKGGRCVGLTT